MDLVSRQIQRLRVLTYNIHKGVCFYTRRQVLSKIKSLIRELDTDLVFLQEIRGKGLLGLHDLDKADDFESQLEYLADSVWNHYAYGQNAVYQNGNHGNAVLSQFPIQQWSNVDISTNPFEKRGLLHASVDHPVLGELHLVCLHLNLLSGGRKAQLNQLVAKISREVANGPLIIAGDFNDWLQGASRQISEPLNVREAFHTLKGSFARSFPSLRPLLCLDRVYYRDLIPTEAEVLYGSPWSHLSDHAALVVDFEIR